MGAIPQSAIYVGDNVDDALASQSAQVPFLGIAFGSGEARRRRSELLLKSGRTSGSARM